MEIEDNIVYVEKEDEFESEASSDEELTAEVAAGVDGGPRCSSSHLGELTKRQRKMAANEIDIFGIDPMHCATTAQILGT